MYLPFKVPLSACQRLIIKVKFIFFFTHNQIMSIINLSYRASSSASPFPSPLPRIISLFIWVHLGKLKGCGSVFEFPKGGVSFRDGIIPCASYYVLQIKNSLKRAGDTVVRSDFSPRLCVQYHHDISYLQHSLSTRNSAK